MEFLLFIKLLRMKTCKKKVVIMNATFDGSAHEIIDASIIIMLSSIYSIVEVKFLNKRSSIIENIVRSHIKGNNVRFVPFRNDIRKGALHDLWAAILEFWTILIGSHRNLYISTFNNMFSCHLNNFVSRLMSKKVILFCHSEVNVVTRSNYKMKDFWAYLINRFYTESHLGRNVKLVVLGDHILRELPKYINSKRMKHFYSIDHPYFKDGETFGTHQLDKNNIKIGVIGGVSKDSTHGYKNILHFAEYLSSNANFKIYLISSVSKEVRDSFPNNVVIVNKKEGYLPRKEYEEAIETMDYILLPYSSSEYNLIASGAVLEAIVRNKPIIMYTNNYFRYLTEKYGKFGYFVEKDKDLINHLNDDINYLRLANGEKQIAKRLLPSEIRKQLIGLL